jgi:hypothetical protein
MSTNKTFEEGPLNFRFNRTALDNHSLDRDQFVNVCTPTVRSVKDSFSTGYLVSLLYIVINSTAANIKRKKYLDTFQYYKNCRRIESSRSTHLKDWVHACSPKLWDWMALLEVTKKQSPFSKQFGEYKDFDVKSYGFARPYVLCHLTITIKHHSTFTKN